MGATSMSPGSRVAGSFESKITRARPSTMPVQPGIPCRTSPSPSMFSAGASRRAHVSGAEGFPSKMNGGTSSSSRLYSARRSRTTAVSDLGSDSNVSISAIRTKPKSSISSKAPRSTIRRPSSRIGIRIS